MRSLAGFMPSALRFAEPATAPARPATPIELTAALRDVAAAIASTTNHPPALGLAMALTALFTRVHSFDAADPAWPDRDRFILSAPDATPLLYALLHLTGHAGMEQASLNHYGDLDAVAPTVAEHGRHPAIEASASPGGQAIAMATGMALSERMLAARFGKSLVDHRVWVAADAAELSRGVTHEAACLAGQLRLDRLVLLIDATNAPAEDARPRYLALGWAVKSPTADDFDELDSALSFALRSRKPTLIWCLPNGSAPTQSHKPTPAALDQWRAAGGRGSTTRRGWLKRFVRHPLRAELERASAARLPDGWHTAAAALKQQIGETRAPQSPTAIAQQIIARMAASIPELLCGDSAPAPSSLCNPTRAHPSGTPIEQIGVGRYAGRALSSDNRPHGMAATLNGVALHAGVLPCATSALHDVAEQLPALIAGAALRRRIVHLVVDSGLSAPGSVWRASEALACLRAIPHLHLFRPGCALETAECIDLAMQRTDGLSVVILAQSPLPSLRDDIADNRCARGGYVLFEADGARQATLIATGAELPLAVEAQRLLQAQGRPVAVVSLPCWKLFAHQPHEYREAVLGDAPRIGIEAAGRGGWDRWLGSNGSFVGCGGCDAAGPAEAVRERVGLTAMAVAQMVRKQAQ